MRGRGEARGWVAVLDAPLLRWTLSRFNPISAPLHRLGEQFGIDLRSAWALQFVRRALPRIAAALLGLAWISTAFQQVGPAEQALHFRLGRLVDETPRSPGLHVVLPWPVDRLERVPVHRTLRRTLGYAGQTIDQSLLWTSRHAEEEYSLLLGDGRDLVAVNGVLSFRVPDPKAFVLAHQDPLAALAALADRELLRETQGRSLDGVLSENLVGIAARIEQGIQREIDRRGLGIEIVKLALIGLHPPVDVAPDYQAVVSSSIQRETYITEGLAYREETLPLAQSDALGRLAEANADSATRLATASGEAYAFGALESSHRLSPSLFEFRMNLEALEQALQSRPFVLVDDRIERDGGSLWILD